MSKRSLLGCAVMVRDLIFFTFFGLFDGFVIDGRRRRHSLGRRLDGRRPPLGALAPFQRFAPLSFSFSRELLFLFFFCYSPFPFSFLFGCRTTTTTTTTKTRVLLPSRSAHVRRRYCRDRIDSLITSNLCKFNLFDVSTSLSSYLPNIVMLSFFFLSSFPFFFLALSPDWIQI